MVPQAVRILGLSVAAILGCILQYSNLTVGMPLEINQGGRLYARDINSSTQELQNWFAENPDKLSFTDGSPGRPTRYLRLFSSASGSSSAKEEHVYRLIDKLGHGLDGDVYKGEDVTTGELVAIKAPKFERGNDRKLFMETVKNEAKLTEINGDLVALGIDDAQDKPEVYLAIRFFKNPSLSKVIEDNIEKWTYKEYSLIARRMSSTITSLHAKGLIHNDLHSDNVLITDMDEDGVPSRFQVIDWGRGEVVESDQTDVEAFNKRFNDYMYFINHGIRDAFEEKSYGKLAPADMQSFNDMMTELRHDILNPDRAEVTGVKNEPKQIRLKKEVVDGIDTVTRKLILGGDDISEKDFLEAKKTLEQEQIEIEIVRDSPLDVPERISKTHVLGFFLVETDPASRRLIADAYRTTETDEGSVWEYGYKCH